MTALQGLGSRDFDNQSKSSKRDILCRCVNAWIKPFFRSAQVNNLAFLLKSKKMCPINLTLCGDVSCPLSMFMFQMANIGACGWPVRLGGCEDECHRIYLVLLRRLHHAMLQ